jgi:hypothetical protein
VDPPLNLRAMGILERTDVTKDLGLVVVLITEGVLDPPGVPVGVRGVTFVISVLGSGFVLVGVVACDCRTSRGCDRSRARCLL